MTNGASVGAVSHACIDLATTARLVVAKQCLVAGQRSASDADQPAFLEQDQALQVRR